MNISEDISFHSKLNPPKMCAFVTMMLLVRRSWRENVQNPTIWMQDFLVWDLPKIYFKLLVSCISSISEYFQLLFSCIWNDTMQYKINWLGFINISY